MASLENGDGSLLRIGGVELPDVQRGVENVFEELCEVILEVV